MKNKKSMIAMSGGVDSSVAAYLIKEQGFDAAGVTMRLFDEKLSGICGGTHCSENSAAEDAGKVAEQLGIPHIICDLSVQFSRKVIDYFAEAYENGSTPNPCVECNKYLKFGELHEYANSIGYDLIATGHYAKISYDAGSKRYLLKKAADLTKDQSYFLYSLDQEQLARTLLPLGDMLKQNVRRIAKEQGFVNAKRAESQDICFISNGDYVSFIEKYTGKSYPAGDFVDTDGNILGRHKGIIRYTIGQRKGLGLALKNPMYVCSIDPKTNRIILGSNEDLMRRELDVLNFNWIACDAPKSKMRAHARIRYRHKESPAEIIPTGENSVHIIFDEPQRAVTSGQSAVLYDGDVVIGGGYIV